MSELLTCDFCGEEFPAGEVFCLDGEYLCPDCLDEQTCVCERCGTRIWDREDHGDETHTLCEDCRDRYYDICAGCGRLGVHDQLHFTSADAA